MGAHEKVERPEFRIEFGQHQGSKWVAKDTLTYFTFVMAKASLEVISKDFQVEDERLIQFQRTDVKMFGPDDRLYHYITPRFPRITLPSREVK